MEASGIRNTSAFANTTTAAKGRMLAAPLDEVGATTARRIERATSHLPEAMRSSIAAQLRAYVAMDSILTALLEKSV